MNPGRFLCCQIHTFQPRRVCISINCWGMILFPKKFTDRQVSMAYRLSTKMLGNFRWRLLWLYMIWARKVPAFWIPEIATLESYSLQWLPVLEIGLFKVQVVIFLEFPSRLDIFFGIPKFPQIYRCGWFLDPCTNQAGSSERIVRFVVCEALGLLFP